MDDLELWHCFAEAGSGKRVGKPYPWTDDMAPARVTTLVLIGRAGNGKSATDNSILGKEGAFKSKTSAATVTATCQQGEVIRPDGRVIRVIDTPGFFDTSVPEKKLIQEISRCMTYATDGFHAVLLVLAPKNRFTKEEANVVQSVFNLLGQDVTAYMHVLFTGADTLEDDDLTMDEYLKTVPDELTAIIKECGTPILFNNHKTATKEEKEMQLETLLKVVDVKVGEKGPYTHRLLAKAQELAKEQDQREKERIMVAAAEKDEAKRDGENAERDAKFQQDIQEMQAMLRQIADELLNKKRPACSIL